MAATMSSTDLIIVSCTNHQQILFNGLCNLFLDKLKADCDMEYTGRTIRVHRVLLDVFMSPDSAKLHTAPDLTPTANPDDPDSNSLDLLVEFLYRGRVNIPKDQLPGLMKVAKVCKFHMLVGAVQAAVKREETKCQMTADIQTTKIGRATRKRVVCPVKSPTKQTRICQKSDKNKPLTRSQSSTDKSANLPPESPKSPPSPNSSDSDRNDNLSSDWNDQDRCVSLVEHPATQSDAGDQSDPSCSDGQAKKEALSAKPPRFARARALWNKELGAFKCDGCPRIFTKAHLLRKHAKTHSDVRPFICECCATGFKTVQNLRVHMRGHNNERPFQCSHCPKTFRQKYSLTSHESTHRTDKNHVCDICGKAFRFKANLYQHRLVHDPDRPRKRFPCSVCDAVCTTKQYLQTHVMAHHTGEKPHVCPLCGKGFCEKATLKIHVGTHDKGLPFVCRICSRPFRLAEYLKRHMKAMHSEKNAKVRPFKCDSCYVSFTQKSSLTQHKRLHTGNLPHKCACGKQFNQRYQFKMHQTLCNPGEPLESV